MRRRMVARTRPVSSVQPPEPGYSRTIIGAAMARYFDPGNHDFDGRPTCLNPDTYEDELLDLLFEVFGPAYAEDLLVKDAAVRAAEAAKGKEKAAPPPELPS